MVGENMNKEKKLLLISIIYAVIYFLFDYFILSNIDLSKYMNNQNISDYIDEFWRRNK